MGKKRHNIRKVHAAPHFHFDVEWWKTEDGYNADAEIILDRAFELLEAHPDFTYVIDQALALRPYWEKHPEMRKKIREWAAGGRIELVGGMFCSPDENIPTGEALARQFIYGKRFFEDVVGGNVETGWEIDTFGHPAQMAQIVAKANIGQFVFARGVQDWRDPEAPIHFYWEAPDGSRVLCNWFAAHYGAFETLEPSLLNKRLFRRSFESRVEYEGARTPAAALLVPFGSDFSVPNERWIRYVREWNSESRRPGIEFSLPRRFFDELRKESGNELPTVRGEFNPLFTGCYESRERIKKFCRRSQHSILDAEKWAAIAWSRKLCDYPREKLDKAWELILENDFHDIICGTGTDPVYRNTLARYEEALSAVAEARRAACEALAGLADTRGGGSPAVIFNSLNWPRREIIGIPYEYNGADPDSDECFYAKGPAGRPLVCQRLRDCILVQADLPPVGFGVVNIIPSAKQNLKTPELSASGLAAENKFLRIELDPKTGCLASVYDKQLGREMLDTSRWYGNELVAEEDAGNLWTVQKTGLAWEGRKYGSKTKLVERGPLRVCFEARGRHHDMKRVQRTYLSADSRRIDFETEIDFNGKDLRVKAMFAPSVSGRPVFETPFYSQPRDPGHWCAQNWADISDGRLGLAVLNSGNPGMDADTDSLGLTLFRSVSVFSPAFMRYVIKNLPGIVKASREAGSLLSRGLLAAEWAMYEHHGLTLREWSSGGGPELKGGWTIPDHFVPWLLWMRPSDAWERGKHVFRYAIYPHEGDWRDAHLPRRGFEFNTPPVVIPSPGKKGALGRSATLFDTGGAAPAILTALKKAEKSYRIVARVYDSLGAGAKLTLGAGGIPIKSCRKINITEDVKGRVVQKKDGNASTRLSSWEIATYLLEV